jgi:hypothetical protein
VSMLCEKRNKTAIILLIANNGGEFKIINFAGDPIISLHKLAEVCFLSSALQRHLIPFIVCSSHT